MQKVDKYKSVFNERKDSRIEQARKEVDFIYKAVGNIEDSVREVSFEKTGKKDDLAYFTGLSNDMFSSLDSIEKLLDRLEK